MRFVLKRGPERLSVEIGGRETHVQVIRNPRARRLILRLDAMTGAPALTLPLRSSLAQGEAFLRGNIGWLERRLARAAGGAPFHDGGTFPLRGEPCRIAHRSGRGLVRLEEGDDGGQTLIVPGSPEHLPRRVRDWLKGAARRDFSAAVARSSAVVGKQPAGIRIGDAGSRWGSCSAKGALAFSWRLVLAPPQVLQYLAAHEVAHLVEMNHGPKFWALVRRLDPQFEVARAWLKRNGASLHAVGRGTSAGA